MIDACRDERLADATSSRVCRNSEHPNRARIRIVHLAEGRRPADECDAADKASRHFRDQDLTSGHAAGHIAQLPLVELVPGIAECSIGIDNELTGGLVFLGLDLPDDDRFSQPHLAILEG